MEWWVGGGGGLSGRFLRGWRCFALNCTAAGCNRRQLEGAEWSSSRWAQPAAPVWLLHRRSNWGPHRLLFLFQILFVCVLTPLFARIWWRWQRKVSANDWKCVRTVCVMYGCVRAFCGAGGRIYFNTGLFCIWCQKPRFNVNLCHTWEGRDHHRSSRWVSSLSLSLCMCVRGYRRPSRDRTVICAIIIRIKLINVITTCCIEMSFNRTCSFVCRTQDAALEPWSCSIKCWEVGGCFVFLPTTRPSLKIDFRRRQQSIFLASAAGRASVCSSPAPAVHFYSRSLCNTSLVGSSLQ